MRLRTQLLSGYAVVFVLMVLMAVVSYHGSRAMLATQKWVEHSREVMTVGHLVQKLMVDMQAAKRGFIIVGNEENLEPYNAAMRGYELEIATLKQLVSDNPGQVRRAEDVEVLVARWIKTVATPAIEERRQVMRGEMTLDSIARRITAEDLGDSIFKDIQERMSVFIGAEQKLLDERTQVAADAALHDVLAVFGFAILAIVLGVGAGFLITRNVLRRVGGEPAEIEDATRQIARGNLDAVVEGHSGIAESVGGMLEALRENRSRTQRQDWLKEGMARINESTRGALEIGPLASNAIAEIAAYVQAQIGAVYVARDEPETTLSFVGSYAYTPHGGLRTEFKPGEGLVGQAALEKRQILVRNVPADYVRVTSGVGERVPRFLCLTPCMREDRLKGVVELGTLHELNEEQLEYVQRAVSVLAVSLESAESRARLAGSLAASQRLTEELQVQHEELEASNEELEEQTRRLQESEARLKTQQEELEVANDELEEKNRLLQEQKQAVEKARHDIAVKADELALAGKYKSEFLANMSHELRTPLNSLLLLAQDLAGNKEGNLTAQQVEAAEIIYGGGSDLLNLINDILDLSKIEAGRMDMKFADVTTVELANGVRTTFGHVARSKGLSLDVVVRENAPASVASDRKRIEQVLKNFMSNAIKFTEHGGVSVVFDRAAPGGAPGRPDEADKWLAVTVQDTGIGIAPEHRKSIFEAFQQGDGGTSRKYGGTGLGLSISREITRLLGGEIQFESEPGTGSTFTLCLPVEGGTRKAERGGDVPPPAAPAEVEARPALPRAVRGIPDDRDTLGKADRVVLVIEDDAAFATLLVAKCHERGLKCLTAATGESGLAMAGERLPSAIILDIRLPGMDGWAVLNALKEDTRTRHIPVHVVSVEEGATGALRRGAIGYTVKPLNRDDLETIFCRLEQVSVRKRKRLLVVEDDERLRRETVGLLGNGDVTVDEAGTGKAALEALRSGGYDCVVLDLNLPDMDGDELLSAAVRDGIELPPVVVHTGRALTAEEEAALREQAESIVIKDVRSPERLLDEVSLFLHRVVSKMAEPKRNMILDLHNTDALLNGKAVLVVDDDMRTTFALARLLAGHGMQPLKAENGERALRLLDERPDVDLVLMDIMMPVMDGYEAMRRIRAQARFRSLPIIVLTAKAMPEDRGKCLDAGANDYLSKPIDPQRLLSMMRVWLRR